MPNLEKPFKDKLIQYCDNQGPKAWTNQSPYSPKQGSHNRHDRPISVESGIRIKILEALSRGIPVVSTTVGAEGIEAKNGKEIFIADNPADFAEAVSKIMEDQKTAEKLSLAGRGFIRKNYNLKQSKNTLESVLSIS